MALQLNNLGISFKHRFDHTNDLSDIRTAISAFQKAAKTFGPPSERLFAAQQWAQLSTIHDLPDSLTAYGIAINLVSEIAGMDRTIEQRHAHLIDFSTLTTSAASAAFAQGEVRKALEWLEQGRCLVWSQLNQLRTSLDHLRTHDEHLAQRFSDISAALEASGSRRGSAALGIDATLSDKISLQDEAHLHIKLSREWSQLLDEIRHIPQFHDFLRPVQASYLLKSLPPNGVVILINVHEARCDALALFSDSSSDTPIHIPLDKFSHKQAFELKQCLRRFLSSHGVRMREADRGGRPVQRQDAEKRSQIHFVLEELWLRVVRPILDRLAYTVSFVLTLNIFIVDFISSLLLHQTQLEYGGVQLAPWCSFRFTLLVSTVQKGNRHLVLACPTLQSPRIHPPSARS